jgi:hypothetical protein
LSFEIQFGPENKAISGGMSPEKQTLTGMPNVPGVLRLDEGVF